VNSIAPTPSIGVIGKTLGDNYKEKVGGGIPSFLNIKNLNFVNKIAI